MLVVAMNLKVVIMWLMVKHETRRCDHNQPTKNHVRQPPKLLILLHVFMQCHFNAMLIMGSCVKWLICVSSNSSFKFI
jgi:hypothetical protein